MVMTEPGWSDGPRRAAKHPAAERHERARRADELNLYDDLFPWREARHSGHLVIVAQVQYGAVGQANVIAAV